MKRPLLLLALAGAFVGTVALAESLSMEPSIRWFKQGLYAGANAPAVTSNRLTAMRAVKFASLDLASVTAATCGDSTGQTVTGAKVGDTCSLGLPAAPTANLGFTCFVSATDTVKIRACNPTAGNLDPAAADFYVRVFSQQ